MSGSHTQNFRLTENLSHNLSPVCPRILVIRVCINNNLSNILKTFAGPSKNTDKKGEREKQQEVSDDITVCVLKLV